MKLIIDIPEEEYRRWQEQGEMDALIIRDSLVKSIPLPKGYGRLIDADELEAEIEELKQSPWYKEDALASSHFVRKEAIEILVDLCVERAYTIIEADKENENAISD